MILEFGDPRKLEILGPDQGGVLGTCKYWVPTRWGFWELFVGACSGNMISLFLKIMHVWEFSKSGSPGQATMLARFESKICVGSRSQSPENSDMSPYPA